MTPTTVSESFVKWMQTNGYGTFGADLFLNQIPEDAIDNAFWVITAGGEVSNRYVSKEQTQRYSVQINYRNISGQEVEHKLFNLSRLINTRGCFTIEGFDLYSIEATTPEDNDRDAENRRQGIITVDIEIYVS